MRYWPQFQHKTRRLLAFTSPADSGKSGSNSGGRAVKKLPFLGAMLVAIGRRRAGLGMFRGCA
jgi:hypothetical protein